MGVLMTVLTDEGERFAPPEMPVLVVTVVRAGGDLPEDVAVLEISRFEDDARKTKLVRIAEVSVKREELLAALEMTT